MTTNDTFTFVYFKNGKIMCMNLERAKREDEYLLSKGWLHVQTIDPNAWIEWYYNVGDKNEFFNELIK